MKRYPVSSRALEKILEVLPQPRIIKLELVNPDYKPLAKQAGLAQITRDSENPLVWGTYLTKRAFLDQYIEQERSKAYSRLGYIIKKAEWTRPCRIILTPNHIAIEHPNNESDAIKAIYRLISRYKIPYKTLSH